ncbi:glycerophosphodiester phosphodiesterase [Halalkalibacillus sediminis]|uniref:Glycerophosphodiester phosphodiesterase n=1 Tax=Halalkalibacillus sediminis TaxID=2018042 RepID=A0A2I0QXE4_9BACI|nr:glycerophosphodiester phosphodiesterase [Halalkalibacillus sediminis]PKR78780.1 glycerophosphodiester phosphodiesterase [Halalkalibacillus sediminis]
MENNKIKKWNKIGLSTLTILGILYIVLNWLPLHSVEVKPFFDQEDPLVIAHQGGEHLAPSSTMEAFENAVELGVDVLETDLHISKDGYLVAIHDPTVDRTTDSSGLVAEMTLDELKSLDAGYYFKDEQEQFPFRDQDVQLITVEELFEAFPDMKFEFEIKDTNPYDRMEEISERLASLITEHQMKDQVLIASFDQEILDTFKEYAPGVALVGGRQEVTKFVVFHKFFVRNLYRPDVDAVQVPLEESGFDLTSENIIDGADRIDLQLHYWTINDQDQMRDLLEAGADGILTDRPDLLLEVIEELK